MQIWLPSFEICTYHKSRGLAVYLRIGSRDWWWQVD